LKSLGSYYFIYYLAISSLLPFMSIYLSEKGLSATSIGMLLSLWAFVSVIAQPVMGMMNDRLRDRRQILMVCIVASPLLAFGFYYFNGFPALIMVSVLFAWFQSAAIPLSDALAVEIGSKAGYSFGSIRLWGALSYAIGVFAAGIVYERFGYGNAFFYYLAINGIVLMTLFLFPSTGVSRRKISLFHQASQVFGNKAFILFMGICLLLTISTAVNSYFLPIYFKEMNFNKAWIGSAFSIAALIEVPMFWISARLNNKIGRLAVLCIAAICYAVKCLVMAFSDSVYPVLAAQLLDGIAFAFFAGAAIEIVDRFSTDETKATFQTVFAAITSGLGGIIGSAFGGILIDQKGAPFLYFILFLFCLAGSILFAISSIRGGALGIASNKADEKAVL
jgi:PPP family 3-phenylpropionic acid transporter